MVKMGLVLHLYQPPTQGLTTTEEVLRQCYIPLCDLLLAFPKAKVTINICGSLLENINAIKDHAFIEKMKTLIWRGQVELLNSAMYHPLLPLIHTREIEQQAEINRKMLFDTFQMEPGGGFFPPELAVNNEVIKNLNSEYVIVDESSIDKNFDLAKLPEKQIFELYGKKLVVNSRAITNIIRAYPETLTAEKFLKWFLPQASGKTVITVSDAEVFGHHYTERIYFLSELFQGEDIEFVTISEAIRGAKAEKIEEIGASTWQTTSKDLKNDNPFPMWLDAGNNLQRKYHQLAERAYEQLLANPDFLGREYVVAHFHRGVSSCHYYWLSNRPWWHPDLVEAGARELIKCVRGLQPSSGTMRDLESFYHQFIMEVWDYHWSGKVEEAYGEYEKIRKESLKELPI